MHILKNCQRIGFRIHKKDVMCQKRREAGAAFAGRTKRMTPDSPEMSFFSVVSFELSIYHKIVKKITPKIGYIRKMHGLEIRGNAGSNEKSRKTFLEKKHMEG